MDLGIWIIISALVGAKLLLLIVDFQAVHRQPAGPAGARALGRRVLRRADRGRRRSRCSTCAGTSCRSGPRPTCSPPASRSATSSGASGCLMAGCCFGRPTSVPWAITFRNPARAGERRHAAGRAAPSDAALRSGRRALILGFLLVFERRGRPFPGRTFWSYMLLYGISRFIIEFYRGDSRGHGVRRAVDVAVRLGHPGAARRS